MNKKEDSYTIPVINLSSEDTDAKLLKNGLHHTLHKNWSFPLGTSAVDVTKSTVSCGSGHTHWRDPKWETSSFGQW